MNQSEDSYRAMIDSMPMMAWRCRPDGFLEFFNRRWLEYTGLSPGEAVGWGWTTAIHPDDRERLTNLWRELLASRQPGEIEARVRRGSGEYRWFLIRAEPVKSHAGDIVRWYGTNIDIEDLKRAESLRAAETCTLEMIADGASLKDVLNHLCSSMDAQASPSVTAILLMDPDRKRLWHSAGPLAPREWISVVSPVTVAMDVGLCGTAAFLKQRVIVTDVATDPNWPDRYRDVAIRNAIRSAWSQPILTKDDQVLGTFAVYCPESRVPSEADLALVEGAGHVARIAIERQRSQEALKSALDEIRRSEAKLGRVIDTIPTLAWCNLPDGSNEFLNKRWHDYTGFTPEESHGWGWQPAFHPEDLPRLMDRWRELLASGEPGEIEARLRRHDGVFRWFLIRVEPLRDENGKIVRWYGTSSDIEDRKRAEEKLQQDERELRRITDAIPQLISVFGANGAFLYSNKSVLDYTGLTLEELNWKTFAAVFHREDAERTRGEREASLAKGVPFETESRVRRRDGQYRWMLIQCNPLRDDAGNVVRWYATGIDIEDRKRAEDRVRSENLVLREEIDRSSMFEEIIGSCAPLRQVLSQVAKVAQTDSTVLILGETGTGKELIARAIHKQSSRSARAFIRVNCGAIPTSLIASELFGHEKGSYTGAVQQRLGRFEAANSGTIFLDEVGDLPTETQIALLRVLQEREIERVGSIHPIAVDVRVLAATNRDLQVAVADGTFRLDLFYRLNVFPIRMPSLRERRDDIPLLAEYLIERYAKRTGKKIRSIGKTTLDLFRRYDWPGNIRELQNVIERAVILSEGETLNVEGTWFQPHDKLASKQVPPSADSLGQSEREMIETALAETHGQVGGPSGAAAKLGLARQTLESKIQALKIDKFRFKSSLTGRELRTSKHR